MGMARKETTIIDNCAIGDNGMAYGFLQINFSYKPTLNGKALTIRDAQTPMIAVNMAVDRLVSNGFPTYLTYSIQTWNGIVDARPNEPYMLVNGKRKWSGYAVHVIKLSKT